MPTLSVLTIGECERLLRRGTFGRVVLATPHGPDIFPVNYAAQGDEVVVRVSPDSQLARFGDGAELLFEVDLVDEERWHGWSVVARGRGQVVAEPGADAGPTARPWVDGDRHCEIRLRWDQLTGRKVGLGWDAEAAQYSLRVMR
jgi:nitroimidazol reductase NimA-like FMN-containing flavoprotein (pyridoxamine 5'-phosphate oxidase superfamily)